MAKIYVALIIKGVKTYAQVPESLKPEVKRLLIDMDLEYLIDEE